MAVASREIRAGAGVDGLFDRLDGFDGRNKGKDLNRHYVARRIITRAGHAANTDRCVLG